MTSCAADMYRASGSDLVRSFVETGTEGRMLVCLENVPAGEWPDRAGGRVLTADISADPYLLDVLARHADVIPAHLGGSSDGACRCPGGPHGVHSKKHKMPCIGHWFNRNWSRWFRKLASARAAVAVAENAGDAAVVWVDSDCQFRRRAMASTVLSWFAGRGVFYLKNRRPVMEAGVVGYHGGRGGFKVVRKILDVYSDGRFRLMPRWDDSYVIQHVLFKKCPDVQRIDLAHGVGERARVVEKSAVGSYLVHDKGAHRTQGVMT